MRPFCNWEIIYTYPLPTPSYLPPSHSPRDSPSLPLSLSLSLPGVSVCRALLDGIDDQDALEAQELQSRVTVGRCTVCMGSTYEEDLDQGQGPDGEGADEVSDRLIIDSLRWRQC